MALLFKSSFDVQIVMFSSPMHVEIPLAFVLRQTVATIRHTYAEVWFFKRANCCHGSGDVGLYTHVDTLTPVMCAGSLYFIVAVEQLTRLGAFSVREAGHLPADAWRRLDHHAIDVLRSLKRAQRASEVTGYRRSDGHLAG